MFRFYIHRVGLLRRDDMILISMPSGSS